MFTITLALIGHWISDFMMQSSWMATNKSTRMDALILHVLSYTIGLLITAGIIAIFNGNIEYMILWALGNGIAHGVVDYFTSKATSMYWKLGDTHTFFVIIGLDQLLHTLLLIGTLP